MWFKRKSKGEKFYDGLQDLLKDHPGEMFICETYLAVQIPDHGIFIVLGDYRGSTDVEANQILVNALDRFEHDHKRGVHVAYRL